MTSRRFYKDLANRVNEYLNLEMPTLEKEGATRVIKMVADTCKADNPSFRYDTFFSACGLDKWGDKND